MTAEAPNDRLHLIPVPQPGQNPQRPEPTKASSKHPKALNTANADKYAENLLGWLQGFPRAFETAEEEPVLYKLTFAERMDEIGL